MSSQTDLEVCPGHLDLVLCHRDQDIGQDRHGVSFLHNALEELQFVQDDFFDHGEFHFFTFLGVFILLLNYSLF